MKLVMLTVQDISHLFPICDKLKGIIFYCVFGLQMNVAAFMKMKEMHKDEVINVDLRLWNGLFWKLWQVKAVNCAKWANIWHDEMLEEQCLG